MVAQNLSAQANCRTWIEGEPSGFSLTYVVNSLTKSDLLGMTWSDLRVRKIDRKKGTKISPWVRSPPALPSVKCLSKFLCYFSVGKREFVVLTI